MTDPKKDETIIELTEVVEEAPSASAGSWMETTPPPLPQKKNGGTAKDGQKRKSRKSCGFQGYTRFPFEEIS